MGLINLNDVKLSTDGTFDDNQKDFSVEIEQVKVYFKNIKNNLVREILKADAVVGCVAWLTQPDILNALAKVGGVSIVVQKEDFLRPDDTWLTNNNWKNNLHKAYSVIPVLPRMYLKGIGSSLSYLSDPTSKAIRCCGNSNSSGGTKDLHRPNMHHKFIVFLKDVRNCKPYQREGWDNEALDDSIDVVPYAVWTGSFNFSENALRSFENAVVIHNDKIAEAYYNEFQQILALSEPLNWEQEWVQPEWRVGS